MPAVRIILTSCFLVERMATFDEHEQLETANSHLSEDETAVELAELLWTALSDASSVLTALSAESLLEEQHSTATGRADLWSDDDDMSTCLSATASEYSLPESETNVEMPIVVAGGVTIVDSLECLARLGKYQPVEADVSFALETSDYEMPPSETDVTMAEPELRLLV